MSPPVQHVDMELYAYSSTALETRGALSLNGGDDTEKRACSFCGLKMREDEDTCPRCGNVMRKSQNEKAARKKAGSGICNDRHTKQD